ncbi:hypothetical protein C8Q77DRAFT_711992 [Trametes polyzona]|nr:hypothetical protein C8Q77DRAFT_711992 [Trametes polyzona]
MVLIEISRWVPRASPALLNPLVLHDPPARRDSSDDRRRTYDFELSAAVTSPSFLSLHVAFCLGHPLRLPCSPFSTPGMFSSVEGNHLHSCTHALRGPPPRSIPRSLWSMPPQAFRDVYRTWALASWSVVRGAPICLCHSISRHALPSLWLGRPTFSKRVNCLVRLGVWRVRIEVWGPTVHYAGFPRRADTLDAILPTAAATSAPSFTRPHAALCWWRTGAPPLH